MPFNLSPKKKAFSISLEFDFEPMHARWSEKQLGGWLWSYGFKDNKFCIFSTLYGFLAFLQIERNFTRAARTLVCDGTTCHFRIRVLGESKCPQMFVESSRFMVK